MKSGKIKINYNADDGFTVSFKKFHAEGFYSGYVLFQALIKAYQENKLESKGIKLEELISEAKTQLTDVDESVLNDLDLTWNRYIQNKITRTLLYEWDSSESWSFILELEKNESDYALIFSVTGGDYDVPFCLGWDCYDDVVANMTQRQYPKLEDHIEDEYFGFNSLIDSSVLDADGKFVFLIQSGIKCFKDIKLIECLFNDIDQSILEDYDLSEINSILLKALP